jgi:isocitrate lyase
MSLDTMVVARTDAEKAEWITSTLDGRDQPFLFGATVMNLNQAGYNAILKVRAKEKNPEKVVKFEKAVQNLLAIAKSSGNWNTAGLVTAQATASGDTQPAAISALSGSLYIFAGGSDDGITFSDVAGLTTIKTTIINSTIAYFLAYKLDVSGSTQYTLDSSTNAGDNAALHFAINLN